jgi:hypothetical protein
MFTDIRWTDNFHVHLLTRKLKMRTTLPMLIILITLSAPLYLSAQESAAETVEIWTPKLKPSADTTKAKADFKISIVPPAPSAASPFQYYLPADFLNKYKQVPSVPAERGSRYRYNMPILRPEKTSKILIAKFDPDFPYSYNMPIAKP